MEKRKHRKTKDAKEKINHKASETAENIQHQPEGKIEHSGGGLTEALRHQDELVQEKVH